MADESSPSCLVVVGEHCDSLLDRLGARVAIALNSLITCLVIAGLMYAIVWMTAAYRLCQPSMRAKYHMAAAMLVRRLPPPPQPSSPPSPQTEPTKAVPSATNPHSGEDVFSTMTPAEVVAYVKQRHPDAELAFQPLTVPTSSCPRLIAEGEVERLFYRYADELAYVPEAAREFIPALIRYDAFARQLTDNPHQTGIEGWTEHWRSGCDVAPPLYGRESPRESAELYLRYANAFMGLPGAPRPTNSVIDPTITLATASPESSSLLSSTGPTSAPAPITGSTTRGYLDAESVRGMYANTARSVPHSILGAPWRLLRFRDPLFAELCDSIPISVLYLLLATRFLLDLRYRSVGEGGLFAEKVPAPPRWSLFVLLLGLTIIAITVFTDHHETWVEVFRFVPLAITMVCSMLVLHCVVALVHTPLNVLTVRQRRTRLLPFLIGSIALAASILWGIYYSFFAVMLRFDRQAMVRGASQIIALTIILGCLLRLARRLLLPPSSMLATGTRVDATASTTPAAGLTKEQQAFFREMINAMLLALPPVIVPFVQTFLAQ